jgi:hypothetical protein
MSDEQDSTGGAEGVDHRPEPPGLPVFARQRWHDGRDTDVPAIATAWTRDAVEIAWDAPGIGLPRTGSPPPTSAAPPPLHPTTGSPTAAAGACAPAA